MDHLLTIGAMATRTGLAASAIRFYETKGLIEPVRNSAGQRRFLRGDIRRLSFILICQRLGYSLEEIAAALAALPKGRNPTARDWKALSRRFRGDLDAKIAQLETLRDKLDGCIGCGCLSLERCALYNADDRAARLGAGPRYLLGDSASD